MVSRYLVDGIVIAGLIAGALGVFYLSLGFFGKHGVNYLRPLLPASVLGGAAIARESISIDGPMCIYQPMCGPQFFGLNPPISNTVLGVLTFGVTYAVVFQAQMLYVKYTPAQFYKVLGLGALLATFYAAATIAWFILFRHSDIGGTLRRGGLGERAILLFFAILLFAVHTSEARLRVIGLILTFMGIATQFLPPILDLLNIPVK